MHSFIMKITHSIPIKDTIAIMRGIYKVVEGGNSVSKIQNTSSNPINSWHSIPTQINKKESKTQENQQYSIKPQQSEIAPKQLQNKYFESSSPIEQKQKYNKKQKNNNNQISTHHKIEYKQFIKDIQLEDSNNKNNSSSIQSKVPSSRFSRIFQFGKLGFNIAESAVEAYFVNNKDPSKQQETYEKIANKISDQLCKMRGAPLKLAQMLSIQQEKIIPAPIRKAFQKARQTAHILPTQEVIFMMQKNFGLEWKQKFTVFDKKPFASASIGQVHKGELTRDNIKSEVAVKIQYPGVRKSISSDISNLNLLMKIPGVFPKGMYMQKILKKTKQQLIDQCDYLLQKQKQEVYTQCLKQCLKDEAELYKVPKVYGDLTTEQIFTSQYLIGVTMKTLEENDYHQSIKDQVGRRIMEITFNEIFEMGIVQSDPNPANFTYNLKTDQLNLFDFGATHVYSRKFLQDYYQVIKGSVLQDNKQIIEASIQTGFLTGQQSQSMNQSHVKSILIVGQPLRFEGNYDFGNQHITQKIYKTIPYMLKNRLKHPPEQVYSLHRKLSGSYLACMRLKAKVNCNKIWQQINFQRIIEKMHIKQKSRLKI